MHAPRPRKWKAFQLSAPQLAPVSEPKGVAFLSFDLVVQILMGLLVHVQHSFDREGVRFARSRISLYCDITWHCTLHTDKEALQPQEAVPDLFFPRGGSRSDLAACCRQCRPELRQEGPPKENDGSSVHGLTQE